MAEIHPLKKWRDEQGITQQVAGERLGVDGLTISRWERRATEPQRNQWENIERVTRLTRPQFLGWVEAAE